MRVAIGLALLAAAECLPRRMPTSRLRRTATLGLAAAIASPSLAALAAQQPGGEAMTDYTTARGLAQEPVIGSFERLPSGARYADIKRGTGAAVRRGSRVSLQWVLRCVPIARSRVSRACDAPSRRIRRSNGYFVDSSEANDFDPFVFTVRP